jgi:hypothetical protein
VSATNTTAAKPNSVALALRATNPDMVAKARSVKAVAEQVDFWLGTGVPYCVIALHSSGRVRLVMAADLERVAMGLELVFSFLEGCKCLWVFDESMRSTVEPLAVANAMGPIGGHA